MRYSLLLLIFVIPALGIASVLWVRSSVTARADHSAGSRIITVEPGMSTQAIVDRLSDAGIVRHPIALRIYLRVSGRGGELKAGDYIFPSPISPLEAIERIERGEVHIERITIPEGYSRFEIARTLAVDTGRATADEFLRLMDDPSPVARFAPEARNLEGYLFPDTYNYTMVTTPEELIRGMVSRFEEAVTPERVARAKELGLSLHQVITIASIIEKEARVAEERPLISSVFANRLRLGMPLASDPTFIYAAKLENDYDGNPNNPRHRRRLSLYNTYIFSGLPPGPIASPGSESIDAALHPADTNYLYFVVSGTGGRHKFSATAAEHEVAVQQYRRQQRALR
ncbi:MAG TPA: endolytic transglycosylase MltG [Blastocatellia bacterium]|nr:endolytic transglycosylase MltG [Blastocatellia bacterium]